MSNFYEFKRKQILYMYCHGDIIDSIMDLRIPLDRP